MTLPLFVCGCGFVWLLSIFRFAEGNEFLFTAPQALLEAPQALQAPRLSSGSPGSPQLPGRLSSKLPGRLSSKLPWLSSKLPRLSSKLPVLSSSSQALLKLPRLPQLPILLEGLKIRVRQSCLKLHLFCRKKSLF